MEENPKSLTPEEQQIVEDRYRFGGFKYSLRSPDTYGPNDIIPQEKGFYTFPNGEETSNQLINIYDSDSPI